MKKIAAFLLCLCAVACASPSLAFMTRGFLGDPTRAPINTMQPQAIGQDFPAVVNGNVTFTAIDPVTNTPGQWDNSPLSYSYDWHCVGGSTLGTASSITLPTTGGGSAIGCPLEISVTASNLFGSQTVQSHWIGPIEASAPAAPPTYETCFDGQSGTINTCATNPETLPVQLTNFIQNGFAEWPGCAIPPSGPTFTGSSPHAWYFDSVNGSNSNTGHQGSPFKNVEGIFNTVAGYATSPLFPSVIQPGDTIYIEPNGTNSVGSIITSGAAYSTSNGTTTGTPVWTWIMGDPAASTIPVLSGISIGSGAGGAAGFIFRGLGAERYRQSGAVVNASGTQSGPTHDLIFDRISATQWIGHSQTPWNQTTYPNSGGYSNGQVDTASPTQDGLSENSVSIVSKTISATQLSVPAIPTIQPNGGAPAAFGAYVWSANSYGSSLQSAAVNGVPDGTVVQLINGQDQSHFAWANGTVTGFTPTDITGLASAGATQTSVFTLPTTENDTVYWQVAATTATNATVYTWSKNVGTINFPANPTAGTNIVVNGVTWTFVASSPTGNQILLGSSLTNTLANLKAGLDTSIATYTTTSIGIVATWLTSGADLPVSGGTSGGVGYGWLSIGTVLATAPTTTDLIETVTFNNHVAHWSGSVWQDLGTPNITLNTCDQVTYSGPGCPTTPYPGGSGYIIPGCDPYVVLAVTNTPTGGCNGSPVPWTGTTRALSGSGESLVFTAALTITPAGYWNWNNWDGASNVSPQGPVPEFNFQGQNITTCPPNIGQWCPVVPPQPQTGLVCPTNTGGPTGGGTACWPNVFQGLTCVTLQNSMARWAYTGFSFPNTTNIMVYNNKEKYLSGDAMEPYSGNRYAIIHNLYTDPTFVWAHQDFIQFGDHNGRGETPTTTSMLFQSQIFDNMAIQYTDQNNYFPRFMQGVNNTENNFDDTYVCCNVLMASSGIAGILITGQWNAEVHNTVIGAAPTSNQGTAAVGAGVAKKGCGSGSGVCGPPYSPATYGALNGLLANNFGPGLTELAQSIIPAGITTPCTQDNETVEGNVGPSWPNVGIETASVWCTATNALLTGGVIGSWPGFQVWDTTDWRTNVAGVSPLLTAYHPLPSPVSPQIGYQGTPSPDNYVGTCLVSVFTYGSCPNVNGTLNFMPNSGFSGFDVTKLTAAAGPTYGGPGTLEPGIPNGRATSLPASGANVGDFAIATTSIFQGGVTYPTGLWRFCPNPGTPSFCWVANNYSAANGWIYVSAATSDAPGATIVPFNPPILHAGTALTAWPSGPKPIADFNGNAWASPNPSAGAIELH